MAKIICLSAKWNCFHSKHGLKLECNVGDVETLFTVKIMIFFLIVKGEKNPGNVSPSKMRFVKQLNNKVKGCDFFLYYTPQLCIYMHVICMYDEMVRLGVCIVYTKHSSNSFML